MFQLSNFDWSNNNILYKNRKPSRAHFYPYGDENSALEFDSKLSDRIVDLNGEWDFKWFNSPLKVTNDELNNPSYDEYSKIKVPLNWQYDGYGKFIYTDLWYPFPVDPPNIPSLDNETGIYRRKIMVENHMLDNLSIRFEGVESAFHLYINGQKVGYSQGSRMPSEFDITTYVHEGENDLYVVVYQYSDGTYLEDQDMWWLGGIIRDVYLIIRKKSYISNINLDTDFDIEKSTGILNIKSKIVGENTKLDINIYENDRLIKSIKDAEQNFKMYIDNVKAWNAEEPFLYTVIANLKTAEGITIESIPQKIGFRSLAIIDGNLLLNGTKILMKGVNRHEYSPLNGRAVTYEQTLRELKLIKDNGMNAIRTSHYPNNPFFYDICDEFGIYVIDEADLETHGFEIIKQDTRLCNDEKWLPSYIDRIERVVERDRNHTCVILWSLGNESSYGNNFKKMYEWCKKNEPIRPVHYEGDFKNESIDVSSTMYSSVGSLYELDTQLSPKRPHILCEFAHAMGNGPGSLKEYYTLVEKSNRVQGIFVWEFKDQGVYQKDNKGNERYYFGGEFGEKFHNGNFCMDGLLMADSTPTPGFYEYAKVIENVHVVDFSWDKQYIKVKNRWDFLNLDSFDLVCTIIENDKEMKTKTIKMPVANPHETVYIKIDDDLYISDNEDDVWLDVQFVLNKDLVWAEKGWKAGSERLLINNYRPKKISNLKPAEIIEKENVLSISGKGFNFDISLIDGRIYNYTVNDKLIIDKGPELNFYRAFTDNDIENKKEWNEKHIHSMIMSVYNVNQNSDGDLLELVLKGKFAPKALEWSSFVTITYKVSYDGNININYDGFFSGDKPGHLPKLGSQMKISKEFINILYHGKGPGECYCDSKSNAKDGIYSLTFEEMEFGYLSPQENGNRTDVKWAVLTNDNEEGFAVGTDKSMDFSVRDVEDDNLIKEKYHCDLNREDYLLVNCDMRNSGLGSQSCGPDRMNQYKVFTIPFNWNLSIVPIKNNVSKIAIGREAIDYVNTVIN
ncbi:beta-galactosidase [Vallitalea longa]|uniref:Beta-galactosidase n=2 Tax=Vallitalea longa TaxID=2936439 RepID=A0A9W5Y8Q7_9FIRM|nr:beta-galactosidase [Vallitalea longa]